MYTILKTSITRAERTLQDHRRTIRLKRILTNVLSIIIPSISIYIIITIRIKLADHLYPTTYQYLSLVVILYALVGNKLSAVTASLLATLAGNYYLMDPQGTFKTEYPAYFIPTLTFFAQSLFITYFITDFRKQSRQLKKVQKVLSTTKERFSYATSDVSAIFLVTSLSGLIIDANRSANKLLTDGGRNLPGDFIFELPIWSANEKPAQRLRNAYSTIKGKRTLRYEDTLILPEKGLTEVEINITSTLGESNEPILILTISDITDKKINKRRENRERKVYSSLINSEFMGLVFTDKNRRITNANKQFQKLIGRDLEDVLKNEISMINLVPERYHSTKAELITKIRSEGFGGPAEIEIVNSSGSMVPVLLSGVIFDPDKEIYLFFLIDLTELKKLEKKKDEFLSVASHEIKTPLTIIKGYLQLIEQQKAKLTKEKIEKMLTIIGGEVEKLNSLLEEILDISRIETHRLTLKSSSTDMVLLINNAIKSIRPIKKSREIVFESASKELYINIDGRRITQVIMNFLTNAIRYTPREKEIIIRLIERKKTILVEVQDFGEGIHPEKRNRIFEKFFQIERETPNTQGMGLGLFISKAIIETHQGKIGVKSTVGKGSTFYFELPKSLN